MATIHLQQSGGGDKKRRGFGRPIDTVLSHFQLVVASLVLAIVALSILFLAEFNNLATQGVIIEELEYKRNSLLVENEVWRMRNSQLKSLDVLTGQEVIKSMADVVDVRFVD
jgi:hypothetical protein